MKRKKEEEEPEDYCVEDAVSTFQFSSTYLMPNINRSIKEEYDCFHIPHSIDATVNDNNSNLSEPYISNIKRELDPDNANDCAFKEEPQEIYICKTEYDGHSFQDINCIKEFESISKVDIKCMINENGMSTCCDGFEEEGMLTVLNNTVTIAPVNKAVKTMPKNYFKLEQGIFALKCIPKNTFFGPYTGLDTIRSGAGFVLKLNAEMKFLQMETSKYQNWMQYINLTMDKSAQNVYPFQCNGFLYYRTTKIISCGQELFVYLDDENIRSFSNDIWNCYYPKEEAIPIIFACIPCCLGFSSEAHLRNHKDGCCSTRGATTEEIVYCPVCKITAFERKYLKYHVKADCSGYIRQRRVPQDIDELYKCHVCNAVYSHKTNLSRHMKRHTGIDYFSCHQCGYRTDRKAALKVHIMRMHTKEFLCSKCDHVSDSGSDLRAHLTNVHSVTSKSRARRSRNPVQTGSHANTNVPEFKCSICGKVLTEKGSLKRHVRVHTGEKPYKCEFCDYQCSQVGSLSKHVKRHTGEKPHVCQICSRSFLEKCKLKRHMVVHAVQKFYCSKCDYSTRSESYLNKHVKNAHSLDAL